MRVQSRHAGCVCARGVQQACCTLCRTQYIPLCDMGHVLGDTACTHGPVPPPRRRMRHLRARLTSIADEYSPAAEPSPSSSWARSHSSKPLSCTNVRMGPHVSRSMGRVVHALCVRCMQVCAGTLNANASARMDLPCVHAEKRYMCVHCFLYARPVTFWPADPLCASLVAQPNHVFGVSKVTRTSTNICPPDSTALPATAPAAAQLRVVAGTIRPSRSSGSSAFAGKGSVQRPGTDAGGIILKRLIQMPLCR